MTFSEISSVFQGIFILLGWVVVHKLSVKRDFDKARREMLVKAMDVLSDEITKIFSLARDYHTGDRDISTEQTIKMLLQDVSGRISMLSDISLDSRELSFCKDSIISLKKTITGLHFEDEHTGKLEVENQQIQAITNDALEAKKYFQQLKHRQFPIK